MTYFSLSQYVNQIEYLSYQCRKSTWTCPVCEKRVEFDSLYIDEYDINATNYCFHLN